MVGAMAKASLALPLLALTSLALVCLAAAEGCDMKGKMVCGDDGITYQNACLAESQGIKVVQKRPCSDRTKAADPGNLLVPGFLETEGRVLPDVVSRFRVEGFNFVGQVKLIDTPLPQPSVARGSRQSKKLSGRVFATRVTPSGHLYIQIVNDTVAPAAGGQAESPPFDPTSNKNTTKSSRKLLVWGTDDRVQMRSRTYPYSAVGNFNGEKANGKENSCSGAMIGASAILTAGHCIYDANLGMFSKRLWFYPGRLSATDIKGVYAWAYATTYWNNARGHCTGNTCDNIFRTYDVAVVRTNEPVGHWTGWFGYTWQSARQGYRVTSAGYPGDKPDGTMWQTIGTLNAFSGADAGIQDYKNGVVESDLDVSTGQSGSHLWDGDLYTRALAVASDTLNGRALHRTMTRSVFDFARANSKGLNLFERILYSGAGITLRPGWHKQLPANVDNWASSATISRGCTALLYMKPGYGGRKLEITKDTPSFDRSFDKSVSSVKVVCS